ncbi:MAG: hypothetical protein U0559_04980 [Anaerolineae bacterium]
MGTGHRAINNCQAERCDPGPDNPYRTPDSIPIVVVVHWSDGSTTEELIACGSLYDPSGYVRDLQHQSADLLMRRCRYIECHMPCRTRRS